MMAKKTVAFDSGVIGSGFKITLLEKESYGSETKIYQFVSGPNAQGFYVFQQVSEQKSGTIGDDDFQGLRDDEDYCVGKGGRDFFDCKGVYGSRSGVFYDHVVGGEDDDTSVLGEKKCYYNDVSRGGSETFLYLEDFQFGDKCIFLLSAAKESRYLMREVSGRYARKLEQAGLFGAEQVLVAKNDKKDILAAFDYEDDSIRMTVKDVLS